jgi:hypothetical protein
MNHGAHGWRDRVAPWMEYVTSSNGLRERAARTNLVAFEGV